MSQERKEYFKAYYEAHKEELNAKMKAWRKAHREYSTAYYEAHKEEIKAYNREDVNSSGKPKKSVRNKSNYYLKKYGTKIPGYEIHHCCTYNEPYKFIYCPKELHSSIHVYLREHNIDADSEHYEQIKHLLDDTVVLYGIK
jgi:hypothetical protein